MAARKPNKLSQYKIRGQFGARGIEQAVFFVWAHNKKQSLEIVRQVAPAVDVVEVRPIDRLILAADVPPPAKVSEDTGPAVPRFFGDGCGGGHAE